MTIPYKEKVISYLDKLTEEAAAIKAVNVVKIDWDKNNQKFHLCGYNTDVIGFTRSIEPLLEPHHKKALILGTGGASKAIHYGLKKLGLETLSVSRRQTSDGITYAQITPAIMKEYEVIVNCTPVGMYPHTDECPDIPYHLINSNHILYDLVYNPDKTLFMHKGEILGATVKNGLEMLLLQAMAAWEIWQEK